MGNKKIKLKEVARVQDDLILKEKWRNENNYVVPKYGFEIRDYGYGICLFCGQRFKRKSPTQKYCNDICREASYDESKPKPAINKLTKDQLINNIRALQRRYAVLEKKYIALLLKSGRDE